MARATVVFPEPVPPAIPMMTGVSIGELQLFQLSLGDKVGRVVRATGGAHRHGHFPVLPLELVRGRFALQTDEELRLGHGPERITQFGGYCVWRSASGAEGAPRAGGTKRASLVRLSITEP